MFAQLVDFLCALQFVSALFSHFGLSMIRLCAKRGAYRRPHEPARLATYSDLLEAIHSVSHSWTITSEHVMDIKMMTAGVSAAQTTDHILAVGRCTRCSGIHEVPYAKAKDDERPGPQMALLSFVISTFGW